MLAHSHVVGRDDASASSGAGNATGAKSGDKGSTDGRRGDACEGSNASIASVHPSAKPSTESSSSSAVKSGGQGWGLDILGVADASGLGVTKENYRAWVSAGAAPAPMGAPSSSKTSTTFLSSSVLKAASEVFNLPTILKPHPSHPSATHHFSTTGSKNEVLQPSKTVHLPPAPFGGKVPVATTDDDWVEVGSMDGDDLLAESNPINAAASAPVAQDLNNKKGKLPLSRAVNHEDAEFAQDLRLATQLSLQTIPGPHGAGSSSNCPWTKVPETPPPALAAASGSPIIKPPLAAPGAHDAGIEYGVLAAEIAADNMAAHIAESMSVEVTFGQQVHYPTVQWQQPYVSFINELITMLAKSDCDISRQQAALPYQDFRSTVRWQGCESIPKSKDSLSMREVVLPISDDNEGAVKGDQVFQ